MLRDSWCRILKRMKLGIGQGWKVRPLILLAMGMDRRERAIMPCRPDGGQIIACDVSDI